MVQNMELKELMFFGLEKFSFYIAITSCKYIIPVSQIKILSIDAWTLIYLLHRTTAFLYTSSMLSRTLVIHTVPFTHPPRHWESQSSHTAEPLFWNIPLLSGDRTTSVHWATHLPLYTKFLQPSHWVSLEPQHEELEMHWEWHTKPAATVMVESNKSYSVKSDKYLQSLPR